MKNLSDYRSGRISEAAVAQEHGSTARKSRAAYVTVSVGVAAFALLQSLVMPVLPTIQTVLHTTHSGATWVLTIYLLSASVFTPVVGRLGDVYGKKRLFIVALGALALGSLVAALATSLWVMLAARVIQGIGGGVLPLAFGIVRDELAPRRVPGAIGVVAALSSVGAGLGVVLAGPIVDGFGYHWLFWIPFLTITLAALAAVVTIPTSRVRSSGNVNWFSAVLLSAWLVMALFAVSRANTWGWGSASTIGLLACGAVVAAVWIFAETRTSQPLIDMRMMRRRGVWVANSIAFLMGIGLYATLSFVPQFLQTPPSAGYGFGTTVTVSGIMLLPVTVGMFVLGLCSGRLTGRFGVRALLVCGSLVSGSGYLTMALAHSAQLLVLIAMVAVGIGFGLAFTAMSIVVVEAVPADQTGVASGMNTNIRTVGGAIGAAVMATMVTAGASNSSGFPDESGYTRGFVVLAAAVAAGAIVASFLPKDARPA